VLLAAVAAAGAWSEYRRASQPVVRTATSDPIYTIADRGIGEALAAGHPAVKLGPMFYGLYPGGFAFRTPEEARAYLEQRKLDPMRWRVYQLAGDFATDVRAGGRRAHLAHSLLAVREVPVVREP
jgi:hypothetical protein